MDPNNPRPPSEIPDPRVLELWNAFQQTHSSIIPQNPFPNQNPYLRQNPSPTQISYPPQNPYPFQQVYSNPPPPPPPYRQNINILPLSQNFSSQENNYLPFSSQTPPNYQDTPQSNIQIEELDDDYNNEQTSGGSVQFTNDEDEALISSFMKVSQDSIVGTNQKREALWAKVESLYEEARLAKPHKLKQKNINSLIGRMRRICKAVMVWGGCFAEANRKKTSGMSEDDVIQMAHKLHKAKFNYEHAWRMLKQYRKWQEYIAPYAGNPGKRAQEEDRTTPTNVSTPETGSSGKRTRLNDGTFSPACSIEDGSASNNRPIGRDAAKKGKGKMKTVIEEVSHFSNIVKDLNFNMTADKDNDAKRLAIDAEKVRVKEKKVNWSILSKLMDCPSLTPEMEEMKAKLIRELL